MAQDRWIVTTESEPWQESEAPGLTAPTGMPSAFLLLEPADRGAILRDLSVPGAALDLSLCRMPVGANDFSRDWYSYDEVPGDLALEHFSIAHDLDTLVPADPDAAP